MRNYIFWIGLFFRILQTVFSKNVVKVLVDDVALLPCHVTAGNSPYVIEWLKRGNLIPIYIKIGKYPAHVNPHFKGRMMLQRNSSTLRISNIQIKDEGWYECRVMYLNDVMSDDSTEIAKNGGKIKLIVTDPPAFKSTPPPSVVAREGESLMLRCRVVGKPLPEVTWRKDGWLINDENKNGEVISGNELSVKSLTRSNRGNYLCQARNSEGQVEHTTTVYVQASPELTVKPINTTVKEGQDAFFGCKASAFPVNIIYSWFYNDTPISQSQSLIARHRALSDGTFVIYDVTRDDVGKVTCQADNGYGSPPSASAYLIIEYPARVIEMPTLLYAGFELSFNIECKAVGVPSINTITWRKDGSIIVNENNARVHVTSLGVLTFSRIRYSDAGHYTCTPYNILGTAGESPIMRVVVKEPPTFTLRPRDEVEGEIGTSLGLNCAGEGDPKPNIYWRKDGEDLITTNNDRYLLNDGNVTITSINKQDFGRWTCVVSNPVTDVISDVMVYVKYTTPHAISNFTVVTSSMSATVTWLPGYDGGYPQHYMIWYKRADKGDHTWLTNYIGGHHNEAVVSNLDSDTVYQFSLLPENALGSGPFSKTISAKTEIPPTRSPLRSRDHISPPRSVTYAIRDDIIELSWKSPFLSDVTSLLGYLIEFRTKKNFVPVPSTLKNLTGQGLMTSSESDVSRKQNKRDLFTEILNVRYRREVSVLETKIDGKSNLAVPLKTSKTSDDDTWQILVALPSNVTSYTIPPNMLFKDVTYEFQISTVTSSAYSAPSEILQISTNGLLAYYVTSPDVVMTSEGDATAAMLAGGVAGGVFVVLALTALLGFCYGKCKINRMSRDYKNDVTQSFLVNRKFKKSASFDSPLRHEAGDDVKELQVTFTKQEGKCDVTKPTGNHVWNKFRLKKPKSFLNDPNLKRSKSLSQGKTRPIAPIVRSSDGKFHVGPVTSLHHCNHDVTMRPKVQRGIRPMSESFLPDDRARRLIDQYEVINEEAEWGSPTCEIDCSQSDIEVRYVPSDQSYRSTSLSVRDDVSSPCFYQTTNRRESRDMSYLATQPRDSYIASSATAEYVYLKDLGISLPETPRSETGAGFRSLDGPMSSYNPTPANPPRGKYHAHANLPGGHYHLSPRASISNLPTKQQCAPLLKQCVNQQCAPLIKQCVNQQCAPLLKQCVNQQCASGSQQWVERPSHSSCNHGSLGRKQTTLSSLQCSNAPSSGKKIPNNLTRVMSLDRHNKKLRPNLLPIKPVAFKKILTSHSTSMTSLFDPKSSKTLKSLSRRSMSEEILGIPKSDTEFSFTSGSASTVRKISCKGSNLVLSTKEPDDELAFSKQPKFHDVTKDRPCDSFPYVSGYDPITSSFNHHAPPTNNINNNHDSHDVFTSSHVVLGSSNHVRLFLAPPGVRDSSASSTESRSRKDASSVDEKYEWDSEFAMECEILEALKNFESCKRTGPVSKDLLTQLQKLNVQAEPPHPPTTSQLENTPNQQVLSPTNSLTSSNDVNYSKESIERRCAALKREYLDYQQRNPILATDGII